MRRLSKLNKASQIVVMLVILFFSLKLSPSFLTNVTRTTTATPKVAFTITRSYQSVLCDKIMTHSVNLIYIHDRVLTQTQLLKSWKMTLYQAAYVCDVIVIYHQSYQLRSIHKCDSVNWRDLLISNVQSYQISELNLTQALYETKLFILKHSMV